jgi:hypothetical protein
MSHCIRLETLLSKLAEMAQFKRGAASLHQGLPDRAKPESADRGSGTSMPQTITL